MLEYRQSEPARPRWPWLLLSAEAIPFAITATMCVGEVTKGDPPDFWLFKADHYAIEIALLITIGWLLAVAKSARRRRSWLMLILAIVWCAWVCWLGIDLLVEINTHPAGKYYRALWRQ